jgi:hypothetical protein
LTKGRGSGYPDFVILENKTASSGLDLWISETQKTKARLHKVSDTFLYELLYQRQANQVPKGYALELNDSSIKSGTNVTSSWPDLPLPNVSVDSNGFTWMFWISGIDSSSSSSNQVLIDSRGLRIEIVNASKMQLSLTYGNVSYAFGTDAQCSEWLQSSSTNVTEEKHFFAFSLDAGSRVVTAFVDGVMCDGGPQSWGIHPTNQADALAAQGWDMIPDSLIALDDEGFFTYSPSYQGKIYSARYYPRFLRTTELLGAWRSVF